MQAQDTTHLDISATHKNLATALCEAQGEITGAKRNKVNPFYNSNYADITAVFNAIREPFYNNGLSVTQLIDVLESGKQVIITRLMHNSGEFIEGKMLLPEEENPQKLGSLITYYRRYALMSIAGIPAEDDDGNLASTPAKKSTQYVSKEQVSDLESTINGNSRVRRLVLENCGGSFDLMTSDRFNGAMKWIKSELAKDLAVKK